MASFKPGDIVKLKTGGPPMTFGGFSLLQPTMGHAICSWFVGKELKQGVITQESLVPYEKPDKAAPLTMSQAPQMGKSS